MREYYFDFEFNTLKQKKLLNTHIIDVLHYFNKT